MKTENRVKPMSITFPDTNETYTLDFSRESVRFAESRGFKISELTDFPQTNIPALFFHAFRKNHQNVSRDKTDKMLDAMEGLTPEELGRLVELYNNTNDTLILTDEGSSKNRKATVVL